MIGFVPAGTVVGDVEKADAVPAYVEKDMSKSLWLV